MFHPLDPLEAADPFEGLAELRLECPVALLTHPAHAPMMLVTRYEDAVAVYRSTPRVGSNQFRPADSEGPQPELYIQDARDAMRGHVSLLSLTGAEHAAVRRVVMGAVIPRAVAAAEPAIRDICRSVAASVPSPGPVDLATAWAATIPSKAIGHLLGFPAEDHGMFYDWTRKYTHYLALGAAGELSAEGVADMQAVVAAFDGYVLEHIQRRRLPDAPDDAITRMVRVNAEAANIPDGDLVKNIVFLLMAGNQTTQSLLLNMIFHLVTSGSYERVRAERTLVARAIEETLRIAPPIQYVVRTPDVDLPVGGLIVPAGQPIAVSNISANHDESVWGSSASTFDVERESAANHLAFATGPHACIGAALARTVATQAMEAFMDRFETVELVPGYEFERRSLWTSWGPTSLDVICGEATDYDPGTSREGGTLKLGLR